MQLGGQDFDTALLAHFAELFKRDTGADALSQPKSLNKLRQQCQEAKHTLSSSASVSVRGGAGGRSREGE